MSQSLLMPVILLHGLAPEFMAGATLWPLEMYLRTVCGFENTHRVRYTTDNVEFDAMLDAVDEKIAEITNRKTPIIVIGRSMGGLIANSLHTKGWNISYAIYIGAPLHGASLLNKLEGTLPTVVRNALYKVPYQHLMTKGRDPEPPHDYHTISMAWPLTEFDGCVFKNEATLDEKNHTHLAWADHRTVFLNPRLWWHVGNKLSV